MPSATQPSVTQPRRRINVVAHGPNRQPRTYRLAPTPARSRQAAYRRLAVAILGLDVSSLAAELRTARIDAGLARAA